MQGILQDVVYGLRILRRNPRFTAIAALTLALGIGANAAVFSVADAFLLRPLPLKNLNRLAVIVTGQKGPASAGDYFDWKAQDHSFEKLSAYRSTDVNVSGGAEPVRAFGAETTADFFDTIDAQPILGRTFVSGDDQPGHDQVTVLSQGLWAGAYGADPQMVGRTIQLNGKPFTVIGVMGPDFNFPVPTDLWTPLELTPQEKTSRAVRNLHVVARLASGSSLDQARAEVATVASQIEKAYPVTNHGVLVHVMPLAEFVEGTLTRSTMFLLLTIVGVVLLIACANIANLQLASGASRERELALRTAVGASRWQIARLLLIENALLALIGGAASLGFAWVCLTLLLRSMPAEIARLIPGWNMIRLDSHVLLFTLAIALFSGLIAGLAPAIGRSKTDVNSALREGGHGFSAGRVQQRLRSIFVVAQVATALALLSGAGMAVRGLRGIFRSASPFEPDKALIFAVSLPASRYPDDASRKRFYDDVLQRLSTIPGVQSAAALSSVPLSNNGVTWSDFQIEGKIAKDAAHSPGAVMQSVSPNFFSLMHVGIAQGRGFTYQDRADSSRVAIVSSRLAAVNWPQESAIGKRIRVGDPDSHEPWLEVVGVAADVLYDWTNTRPESVIYRPVAQASLAESLFALRVAGGPYGFVQPARAQLAGVDSQVPAFAIMSLSDSISESLVGNSEIVGMMQIMGMIALVIAIVGVYGIVAYAVAERSHEFGIRMALGAQKWDVFRLVMRNGLLLAIGGVAIGVPVSWWLGTLLSGGLFGVAGMPIDLLAAIAALLVGVTLTACWLPARRATNADPLVALRHE
jgi:putative ABC transport system permease protein